MPEQDSAEYGGEAQRTIPTIDPEKEPEYVGAHSAISNPTCQNWLGESRDDIERCLNDATHTVVMYSGKMHQVAMCDECGEPEDTAEDREWSGQLEAGA